ncbi:MAG TPA: FKBP-type peptidyl-prolyl cis-trans isomerase [Azospirillaceae bacterium]|nr:FKBP-type peptidyl-prolyl cis-trans isomerase [Azospirillaceae bacterium]
MNRRILAAALLLSCCAAPVLAQLQPPPGGQVGGALLDSQKQYIADYKRQPGVIALPSGVVYKVLRPGKGVPPNARLFDEVRVHYEGKLIDGTVFDSSYRRDEASLFRLDKLVRGWQEVIPLMKIGEKVEMVVPAEMGYGAKGKGTVPPGATMVFTMELFEVVPGTPGR